MSSDQTKSLQTKLEVATRKYQDLQDELSKTVEGRQRLEAQQVETENVKKEFATLKPSNTIYKLVGPVLLPQDQSEAKSNVEKRLEFISSELKRVDAQIKDIGDQSERVKTEIVQIQTTHQALQQGGAAAVSSS
ncbi:hypothetical protein FRB91_003165 [Serendipita sp. 411]|nr:hypothetical protein FRC18_004607 [Serendipita sp. 400]KAG8813478.1 hypothetical protein FRC19_002391 [Serendipita sp. 401]KAG8843711.1 hypothetical protein FRB91_003165 [Serendipita sp. 411]